MVFSSITFLFFFLPLTLLFYWLAGVQLRNTVLLLASLLFYSWGEGLFLVLMLVSIVMNYWFGRLMTRPGESNPSRLILTSGIIANIGILAFFKYGNFFIANINILLDQISLPAIENSQIHLPIGISFFTFQAISYIIDVYRNKVEPQKNLISLSLYISLFPQLIAGPIVRYHQIARQLACRTVASADFAQGAQRFLFGLAKKVLLANPMGAVVDLVFSLPDAQLSPEVAWLGAICYAFQIYFDFSGYSDMAIGLGRIFGFQFPENFKYPYISSSIREFWQRWHISLSSWFRDYLYIPLGGNRAGRLRTSFNLLTVFLLCGLWHGASWTFVLWGLYHGFFLTLERTFPGTFFNKLWLPLRRVLTLIIIICGWVLFRSESIAQAAGFYSMMFGLSKPQVIAYPLRMLIDSKFILEFVIAILISMPLYPLILRLGNWLEESSRSSLGIRITGYYVAQVSLTVLLAYYTVISLAAGAYNPFIYFRF